MATNFFQYARMDNCTKLSSILCTTLLSTNFYEIDVILDKNSLSLATGFFLRERDKIFYTYSGPWASHTSSAKIYSPNYHHPLLRAPLDFQTLRRPCGDIKSCEIQKHSTRYEREKNIVSTIARIELTLVAIVPNI